MVVGGLSSSKNRFKLRGSVVSMVFVPSHIASGPEHHPKQVPPEIHHAGGVNQPWNLSLPIVATEECTLGFPGRVEDVLGLTA